MAEYIKKFEVVDRLTALENECQQYKPFHGFEHAMYRKICEAEIAIGKTPAEDVAPVVHGRWIPCDPDSDVRFYCSECGTEISTSWDYDCDEMWNGCPHCLARMDGGGNG